MTNTTFYAVFELVSTPANNVLNFSITMNNNYVSKSYQFTQGMTWADWINSNYDRTFPINGNANEWSTYEDVDSAPVGDGVYVSSGGGSYLYIDNVTLNMTIVADTTYIAYMVSGGGAD